MRDTDKGGTSRLDSLAVALLVSCCWLDLQLLVARREVYKKPPANVVLTEGYLSLL